jgi:hypothetical protein
MKMQAAGKQSNLEDISWCSSHLPHLVCYYITCIYIHILVLCGSCLSSLANGSVVVTTLVVFLSSFASYSSLVGDSSFVLFV